MAIYLRKGSRFWWYSVSRGRGVPRVCGSTGKESKEDALAVEQIVRQAMGGKTAASQLHALVDVLFGNSRVGLPLAGVWDTYASWLDGSERSLSEGTRRQRRRVCERFASWCSESWPAARFAGEVSRACAAAFAAFLKAQGVGPKTRRNLIADLGTVWEGLKRVRDDVPGNPWALVLPNAESERLCAFTRDEEAAVLQAAKACGHDWWLACVIARQTGLRYGDVARLRWDQVDLKARVIQLKPSKTRRHGVAVTMPISEVLLPALQAAVRNGEFVLPEHAACYPRPERGSICVFSEVLKRAKVQGRHTFHSWRHTFRTRLSEAGVSDELAKRLGGWTVDATAMRYDHDGRLEDLRVAVNTGGV